MNRPPHEHPIYRFSSVGRPVDPRFATNKAILIVQSLAAVVGSGVGFALTRDWTEAAMVGLTAALVVFLAWAVGRELDPDNDATAFFGVACAAGVWVWTGETDLWMLGMTLLATRIVGRTVGPPARLSDALVLWAAAAAATWVTGRWSLATLVALAFGLDAVLPQPRRIHALFAAAAAGLAGVVLVSTSATASVPASSWTVAAVVVLGAGLLVTLPPVTSPTDLPGHAVSHRRIQAAIALAVAAVGVAAFESNSALPAPTVAAVLVAAALGRAARPRSASTRTSAGA